MSNKKTNKSWDAAKATRDVVVETARQVQVLKDETTNLAHKAGKKWEESKPQREKAKSEMRKATDSVVNFGKQVKEGFNQGIADVQKKKKKA
ncbi:MAG TPA: hypothetical protein VMR46_02815 [Candidatus Paceibacterota bacterium]|nr:hypothetical protein [Candidatus Paceibacterota bacterium]